MRKIFRSDRHSAVLLLSAAILGLLLANTALGPFLLDVNHAKLGPLSVSHWISDLLLALFFFIVAVELKHELTHGQLNTTRKALVPAIAALGGVIIPAVIYLVLVSGSPELAKGWPIPTATDIAFALGVLAIFGRGLPGRLRVFLLAFAVLDDLVGILFIAVIFTDSVNIPALLGAVACIVVFGLLSRVAKAWPLFALLAIVAAASWYLVLLSGVHATLAGVGLGLAMAGSRGMALAHHLQPWSNGIVLPLFAFSAALVVIPSAGSIGPVVLALALALPTGKAIGITLGGLLGAWIARKHSEQAIRGWDLVTLGVTGGIGFTVALLMNQLAFRSVPSALDQGVLGVLLGSAISVVAAAALISWRARVHRRSIGRSLQP